METRSILNSQELSLRKKIKTYQALAKEVQVHLSKRPEEWGRFQSDFNQEINGIFRDIMLFEKNRLSKGDEASVYKLKRIFINHLRKEFLHGDYIVWSFKKPYGYAGDFRIIDDIYLNNPKTQGFERLYDNYFMMCPASVATRNRKDDFKRFVFEYVKDKKPPVEIMDLASGSCRDIHEFSNEYGSQIQRPHFHCYENDERAIRYARKLCGGGQSVSFIKENVVRLALRRNIEMSVNTRFDLIFSTGLFDYLDRRIGARLVANLRKLMKPDALMIVSNYRDKYSNPALHFMEWVGDWNLVYRTEEEFMNMFTESGFNRDDLSFQYEQLGIMQYCLAHNRT